MDVNILTPMQVCAHRGRSCGVGLGEVCSKQCEGVFFFLVVVWSAGPYNLPDFVQSVESLKNLKGISLMAREEAVQTHNPESASVKTVEKEGGEPSVEPP